MLVPFPVQDASFRGLVALGVAAVGGASVAAFNEQVPSFKRITLFQHVTVTILYRARCLRAVLPENPRAGAQRAPQGCATSAVPTRATGSDLRCLSATAYDDENRAFQSV